MDIALFRKFVCDITDCRDEKNAQRDFQRAENVYKYFLASQDQTKSDKIPDVIELCNTLSDHVHVVD